MGLTPMRSEKCLNELENKYEYDIVLNGQGHYAYNISSSKQAPAPSRSPLVYLSNFAMADLEYFICVNKTNLHFFTASNKQPNLRKFAVKCHVFSEFNEEAENIKVIYYFENQAVSSNSNNTITIDRTENNQQYLSYWLSQDL